jgi:hypothetical protein
MFALAQTINKSVEWIGENVSSPELSEWIALLSVEPWGPYRADLLNAISAYASAAPWCKGTKVSDWMPQFSRPEPDREQLLQYLTALGGKARGNHSQNGDQPGLERQPG